MEHGERLTQGVGVIQHRGVTVRTHLFEEPGKLEAVAELARDWFLRHLTPR